jgi:hypothetical protein
VVDYLCGDADDAALPKLKTLVSMGQAEFGFAQPLRFQHWDELSCWYYKEEDGWGAERGPVSSHTMERLVRSGTLSLDTPVLEANHDHLPEDDRAFTRLGLTCLVAFFTPSEGTQSRTAVAATTTNDGGNVAIKAAHSNGACENALAAPPGSSDSRTSRSTSPSTSSTKDQKTNLMKKNLQERMAKVQERMREIEATRSRRSRSSSRSPPGTLSSALVSTSTTMTTTTKTAPRPRVPWMLDSDQPSTNTDEPNSAAVKRSISTDRTLGEEVLQMSQWCRLTPAERCLRTEFILYLNSFLLNFAFPEEEGHARHKIGKHVLQFGSTLSGLDTFLSDVDMLAALEPERDGLPTTTAPTTTTTTTTITTTDGTTACALNYISLTNKADDRGDVDGDGDGDIDGDGSGDQWPQARSAQDTLVRSVLQLAKALRELPNISNCKAVATASVPVIKATDAATGFTVDIVLMNQARVKNLATGVTGVAARVREAAADIALFTPIVHFVQLLLHHHKLGELYGGGMNSFRVYVIVLSFLRAFAERRAGPHDATEAVMNFLEFHGRPGVLEQSSTMDSDLTEEPVSFQAVYRIKDIAHLFRTTHLILARGKRTNGSLLAPILNVARFTRDTCRGREEAPKKK